jgi:hypothetical protein
MLHPRRWYCSRQPSTIKVIVPTYCPHSSFRTLKLRMKRSLWIYETLVWSGSSKVINILSLSTCNHTWNDTMINLTCKKWKSVDQYRCSEFVPFLAYFCKVSLCGLLPVCVFPPYRFKAARTPLQQKEGLVFQGRSSEQSSGPLRPLSQMETEYCVLNIYIIQLGGPKREH